jgi:hypothetical protein
MKKILLAIGLISLLPMPQAQAGKAGAWIGGAAIGSLGTLAIQGMSKSGRHHRCEQPVEVREVHYAVPAQTTVVSNGSELRRLQRELNAALDENRQLAQELREARQEKRDLRLELDEALDQIEELQRELAKKEQGLAKLQRQRQNPFNNGLGTETIK